MKTLNSSECRVNCEKSVKGDGCKIIPLCFYRGCMSVQTRFKERVKNIIISSAVLYKQNFVDCEYLVCSDAFTNSGFYIIDAKTDNYQHLTGVHSLISPSEFFTKSYEGNLQESDFDFVKPHQNEKEVKGTVREKIIALPSMMTIFDNDIIMAEENFAKNKVICTFAAACNECTVGFVDSSKARPKSLIKGNKLDNAKAKRVNLILRRSTGSDKFDVKLIGSKKSIRKYFSLIKDYIDESLVPEDLRQEIAG